MEIKKLFHDKGVHNLTVQIELTLEKGRSSIENNDCHTVCCPTDPKVSCCPEDMRDDVNDETHLLRSKCSKDSRV